MKCEHAERMIHAAQDGTLSAVEREGLRSHLAGCAACLRTEAETTQVAALLTSLPRREVTAEFDRRLYSALRQRRAPSRFLTLPRIGAGLGLSTAAAALAVMLVGIHPPQPTPKVETRREFLASVVSRHQQLRRDEGDVDWDAVQSSVDLNSAALVSE
jgi:anti-sigma factor RsiW